MDDIIKYDVRTYVEELVKKEFSFKNNEEKIFSDNSKTNTGENRNVQRRSLLHSPNNGRMVSDLGQ